MPRPIEVVGQTAVDGVERIFVHRGEIGFRGTAENGGRIPDLRPAIRTRLSLGIRMVAAKGTDSGKAVVKV